MILMFCARKIRQTNIHRQKSLVFRAEAEVRDKICVLTVYEWCLKPWTEHNHQVDEQCSESGIKRNIERRQKGMARDRVRGET